MELDSTPVDQVAGSFRKRGACEDSAGHHVEVFLEKTCTLSGSRSQEPSFIAECLDSSFAMQYSPLVAACRYCSVAVHRATPPRWTRTVAVVRTPARGTPAANAISFMISFQRPVLEVPFESPARAASDETWRPRLRLFPQRQA